MTIGTLGRKIVFEVSDETALILQEMTRETSGRWAIHEAMGAKPKAEFLGPGLQTVNLTIYLSAGLGVRPRSVLEAVEGMVEAGTAEYWSSATGRWGKSVSADRIKRNLVHHIQPRGAGKGRPVHHAGGIRMNISPFDFQLQFTFANDAMAELDRKLALLYSTREGTMPLDREFGINMDFVDMPPEVAKSLYTAEITKKTAQFIPEVRVQSVQWSHGGEGVFYPKVVITSA